MSEATINSALFDKILTGLRATLSSEERSDYNALPITWRAHFLENLSKVADAEGLDALTPERVGLELERHKDLEPLAPHYLYALMNPPSATDD